MKYPALCLLLVCIFTAFTTQPFTNSNATELWNSKSGSGKTSGYYNKRNPHADSGEITIYNRTKPYYKSSNKGLRNTVNTYKKIKMARSQKPSKLWGRMSRSAVQNRQADIDLALQREYNNRKRAQTIMIKGAKQRKAERIAGEKVHKAALKQFYAKKEAKKAQRLAMKQRALRMGIYYNKSPSNSQKSYRSISERTNSMGIKKPRKLFNDPRN